jgi:CDP-diglyceride synthetase
MLKTRVLTALILLPIVLGLFIFGPAWFVIGFIMLCMTLSIFEASTILIPTFEKRLAPSAHRPGDTGTVTGKLPARKYTFPAITMVLGILMLLVSANSRPDASVGVIART